MIRRPVRRDVDLSHETVDAYVREHSFPAVRVPSHTDLMAGLRPEGSLPISAPLLRGRAGSQAAILQRVGLEQVPGAAKLPIAQAPSAGAPDWLVAKVVDTYGPATLLGEASDRLQDTRARAAWEAVPTDTLQLHAAAIAQVLSSRLGQGPGA